MKVEVNVEVLVVVQIQIGEGAVRRIQRNSYETRKCFSIREIA